MYYAIRITTPKLSEASNVIRHYFLDCYILASEVSSREVPHLHIVVSTEKDTKTIRAFLKRKLELSGNAQLSVKQVFPYEEDDVWPIEACAYLFKQDTPEVKGVPQDTLDRIHSYNLKVKEEIQAKKDSKKSLSQALDDVIIPRFFEGENLQILSRRMRGHRELKEELLSTIISVMVDRKATISKSSIESKYNYFMCKYSDSHKKSIIDALLAYD